MHRLKEADDGRRRRLYCHLDQLGPPDGPAETVSGLELFVACAVLCCFFLRAVRKNVSPPRVSAASVVQPTPVHTHRDESPCEPCVPVDVAVLVVDWRALGSVAGLAESFLREVMVKPVMG